MSVLTGVLARKAAIEAEIREIETFVALHEKFAGRSVNDDLARAHLPPIQPDKFLPTIQAIFEERGRPMRRGEILRALWARGYSAGGKDEPRNLNARLWRARHAIINIHGAGFWFRDRPWPAA